MRRRTRGGRRYPAGHILTPQRHKRGYVVYKLTHDGQAVSELAHRLVAFAFLGAPPTSDHEVAHDDGTRTNNHWRNLLWKTPVENQGDRKRHGTYMAGESCPSAKLTDARAEDIRLAYAAGGVRYRGGTVTMAALASRYGVSIAQISRIVSGRQRVARPS